MRPIDQAREQVEKINKEITADDKRLKGAVRVVHGDGSTFVFNYAFIVEIHIEIPVEKGNKNKKNREMYIGVVSEHHLPMVFAEEDLDQYDLYKMTTKQFRNGPR